ncbi:MULTISPECIES: hypothetical protein [unclassified Streptomyces]|uniref:hypothetical protein n=1 Tax=unclassified Streptomyces TaxID=2593676 RepID=UPI000DB990A3|nr:MULTISPECIES: hypothetical protein [Streptomyces]MYU05918.1 hypothetical protein [Streptomyces sp. SID8366]MYU65344.1 hypothetical protein [Streptomyces sp. SID69]RAJ63978.1 hypothetical protein K376_01074 [Streptomyces sp. PsTaAH-130]TXJ79386.1 hypothetical protein E2C11_12310 [Streptomyces lavendulae]
MSGGDHGKRPETALEEVLHEVERAELRDGKRQADGEAGDALSPSTEAQEQSGGDRTAAGRRH